MTLRWCVQVSELGNVSQRQPRVFRYVSCTNPCVYDVKRMGKVVREWKERDMVYRKWLRCK